MASTMRKPLLEFSVQRVSSRDEIAPEVFMLRFERPWEFRAGQVVALRLEEGEPHRLYSLAGGENEKDAAVLFDLNPEGSLTPRLARLQPGDSLRVSHPFGFFTDDERPAWWLATGTGLAPFLSMVRSLDIRNKTLVHGGRGEASFYFQEELSASLGARYIRCSSTGEGKGAYPGRLTAWLGAQEQLDPGLHYYLCGSAEMVVDVRDLLISRGVPFEHVRAEIYF
ncbi:MAG TPA: hypothetical protein P5550_02110 [Bacteroidales bacterium]|nr:hypothetical protein [Bacteroidales bacterium]HRZ76114.1 hypothetical protein [Bacteroidales bacterium]